MNGRQTPIYERLSVDGDDFGQFVFRPELKSFDSRTYEQRQIDIVDYKNAREIDTINSYETYLKQNPNGSFRGEALARQLELADETDWEYAQLKGTKEAYTEYLKRHDHGKYAQEARQHTDEPSTFASTPKELPGMVFIEGGTFEMGDQFGDGFSRERPVHEVSVSSYFLGRHQVTFAEYANYCAATGKALLFWPPKRSDWITVQKL